MNDESQRAAEAFIPTRIVVESKSFDRLVMLIESPPEPTESLRALMRGERLDVLRATLPSHVSTMVERA